MNTSETLRLVLSNNVRTLRADKSEDAPEVDQLLMDLGNKAATIPFVAIFPAARPNEPILLSGPITQQQVLDALQEAGPSHADPNASTTAMSP